MQSKEQVYIKEWATIAIGGKEQETPMISCSGNSKFEYFKLIQFMPTIV